MPSWSYIVDFRDQRERRLAPIREMSPFLSEADRGRWADVQAIVIEKFELDVQYQPAADPQDLGTAACAAVAALDGTARRAHRRGVAVLGARPSMPNGLLSGAPPKSFVES